MYKSELQTEDDLIDYLTSNDNEYIYMTYPKSFISKPTADDCSNIQLYFNTNYNDSYRLHNCKDLVKTIQNGQTCKFAAAIGSTADDFKLSNMIALDIDCGIDYNILLDKMIDDGMIDYLICGYHSFSSKPDFNRVRLICRTPIITYNDNYNKIFKDYYTFFSHYFGRMDIKYMIKDIDKINDCKYIHNRNYYNVLYTPESMTPYIVLKNQQLIDKQTSSPTNLFHGGCDKSVFYTNDNARPLSIQMLATMVESIERIDDPKNYSRKLKSDVDKLDNKLIKDIDLNNNDDLKEYEVIDNEAMTILYSYDIPSFKKCCKLFDSIEHSQHHHNEYMHLIYNINVLSDDIKDYFVDNALQHDSKHKWDMHLQVSEYREYNSTHCSDHCPYYQSCHNTPHKTILDHLIDCFNGIDNTKYYSLDECRNEAKDIFKNMVSNDNDIELWKADCGIGKSWCITHYDKDYTSNVNFAFDNHRNKEEKYIDYITNGGYTSAANYKHIDNYNIPNIALIKKAFSQGDTNRYKDLLCSTKDGRDYYNMSKKPLDGISFITHEKFFTAKNNNNDLTIFDEDPLQCLNKVEYISTTDANNLYDFIAKSNTYLASVLRSRLDLINHIPRYIDDIAQLTNNNYEQLCNFIFEYLQTNKGINCYSNLYLLISQDTILMRDVYTYSDKKGQNKDDYIALTIRLSKIKDYIQAGGKIKVMSATVNADLYKLIFGDKVNVIDSKKPKNLANIILHNEYSFSKSSLLKDKNNVRKSITDAINKMNCLVITTKDSKGNYDYNVRYGLDKVPHLGAASGYNDFNNIDKMVVLGKLVLPETLIKLYRFALFGKYDEKTRKVKQTIRYNNKCKLNYFTYDNEEERLIDLWYTGSMLQQAIGRARGVTNPCEIHVYTDFPI